MSNPIEDNAYRILGLDTTASQTEILRRYKEIINRLKISDSPKYDLDIGLPERSRTESAVKDALKELQSPKECIKSYFFWFQISNNNDKKALDYLTKGEFPKAIHLWKSLSKSKNSVSFFYKKNLAVLYCLALMREENSKYIEDSLSIWSEILKSDKFWLAFSKNYNEQNAQTASEKNMSEFREAATKELSDIYADLGRNHKNPKYVKKFQEVFAVHGERTEKEVLQPTYQTINNKIDELKKIRIDGDDKEINSKIIFIDQNIAFIKIFLDKLRKNGLYNNTESKVVRDHVAEAIRAKAVDIYNIAGLYEEAARLAKEAGKISGTESYKKELEEDEARIGKGIEADKNSLISVAVSSLFSTKYAEFKPRFVEYDGKKIFYKDVYWVAFYGVRRGDSGTFSVVIDSKEKQVSFSISDPDVWNKVFGLASQLIIPFIVKKYADQIFEHKLSVGIGNVQFDRKGYTISKNFGGTEFVRWNGPVYAPKFFWGNVLLYRDENGKGTQIAGIPMSTPNAVIIPALVRECVNRTYVQKTGTGGMNLDTNKPRQTLGGVETFSRGQTSGHNPTATASNEPPEGSQEYYDKIDREQRPELLRDFEGAGGKSLSAEETTALLAIREAGGDGYLKDIDSKVLEKLVAKGYIRKEKGWLTSNFEIEKKGYKILNWVLYKYK